MPETWAELMSQLNKAANIRPEVATSLAQAEVLKRRIEEASVAEEAKVGPLVHQILLEPDETLVSIAVQDKDGNIVVRKP